MLNKEPETVTILTIPYSSPQLWYKAIFGIVSVALQRRGEQLMVLAYNQVHNH